MLILIIAIACFYTIPCALLAQEQIIWFSYEMEPLYIHKGRYAGKGQLDIAEKYLIDRLDGYAHVRIKASVARILSELKNGRKMGVLGLLKTPAREKFFGRAAVLAGPTRPRKAPKALPSACRSIWPWIEGCNPNRLGIQ